MPLSDAGKNVALDALGAVAVYFSLHSADPGSSGTSELSGGSPAYARQQGSWDPASGGSMSIGGSETFNVPAGATVAYFGIWSASTGGTFYGGGALSASENFQEQGTYTLTDAEITLTDA